MSGVWSEAVLYLLEFGIDLIVRCPVFRVKQEECPLLNLRGSEFGYQVQTGIWRRSTPQLDMCGSG